MPRIISKYKERILQLRAEGKTFKEIMEDTGCGMGTISYHCAEKRRSKKPTQTRVNSGYREQILQLRSEGKTYQEITEIVGCGYATTCYHLSDKQKHMRAVGARRRDASAHPYKRKLNKFLYRKQKGIQNTSKQTELNKILYIKIQTFLKGTESMKNASITVEDIINKFGENPVCYLTGDPIDIYLPSTYQFDHIIPTSKGGMNTLDNLGICTKNANLAKSDMTLEEFYVLCQKVIDNKNRHQEPASLP